jgi:hypothetical protein
MTDQKLWNELIKSESNYQVARWELFKHCSSIIGVIKKALHIPYERKSALRLIEYLTDKDYPHILDDLIEVASVGHSDIELCRKVILALPQKWLLSNIEESLYKALSNGEEEEYRRLMELCILLSNSLLEKLINKALLHPDDNVKEVGIEFQVYLNKPKEFLVV